MVSQAQRSPEWAAIRRAKLAEWGPNPSCWRCGRVITGTVVVGHVVDLAVGGSDADGLAPECEACSWRSGGKLGARMRGGARGWDKRADAPLQASMAPDAEDLGGPGEAVWAVPWLADLLDVPADATWPRFMSAPHPDAVGSYGEAFEEWSARRWGRPLRWWQRLAARRILEHDASGQLVWRTWLLTMARQLGKSVLVRELCAFRMVEGQRLLDDDEAQTVLSVANSLQVAKRLQRPVRSWAQTQPVRFRVLDSTHETSIEERDSGSQWLVKASRAGYSLTLSLAVADEAWEIPPGDIDDGIEPTLLARICPQLGIVSTAHRKATALFPDRRAQALGQLGDPARILLLEWSAPAGMALDDRDGWRMASPHWDARREELLDSALQRALTGTTLDDAEADPVESFKAQYLNQWPLVRLARKRGADLFGEGEWAACKDVSARPDPDSPVWLAVEDNWGRGAALAGVLRGLDGRWLCWTEEHPSRDEALAAAAKHAGEYEYARTLIGATMIGEPKTREILGRVDAAGQIETRRGLPAVRDLVRAKRVAHLGAEDLDEQLTSARVLETAATCALIRPQDGRVDSVKALIWALQSAALDGAPDVAIG